MLVSWAAVSSCCRPHFLIGGTMKIFETQNDLDNEKAVCEHLTRVWGFNFYKLDRRYQADFLAVDKTGKARAWVEIKCRNITRQKYPDIILELDKCLAMKALSEATELPAIFVARWTDALGWIKLQPPFDVSYTGANDRYGLGGSPCTMLPVNQFTLVEMENDRTGKQSAGDR